MRRPSLFTTMWRGAIDVREGILFILYPHRNRVPPREALKGKRVQNVVQASLLYTASPNLFRDMRLLYWGGFVTPYQVIQVT